ncbi:MAG: hypothetical protein QW703_01605 [Candidatus Aenigmatarchaeota archaeon]
MDGKQLFYRYALSCIRDAELEKRINNIEREILLEQKADDKLLEKAFPHAWQGAKTESKGISCQSVRRYFWFKHNSAQCKRPACIAWPAQVKEKKNDGWFVELKPICKVMWVRTDLKLKTGDWVIVHRQVVAEKVSKADADKVTKFLKSLFL